MSHAAAHDDTHTHPHPANGKTGEMLRWLFMLAMAAVVSYFSGQIASERRFAGIEADVASSRVLEQQHFDEIQRSLVRIEAELVRMRVTGK